MTTLPSDFKILSKIYEEYYNEFKSFNNKKPSRETKTYVPIDITIIAKDLNIDEDILFGRLYNHLDKKYGYKNESDKISHFFAIQVGKNQNAIHFPLLASVLSGLQEERKKQNISIWLSIIAITISLIALTVNGFKTWNDTRQEELRHNTYPVQHQKLQVQDLKQK